MRAPAAALLAMALGLGAPLAARAADLPTFTLTFQPDGTFEPARPAVGARALDDGGRGGPAGGV